MGLCWQMPKFIVWRLWSIYFDHHLPLKPSIGKWKQSCIPNIFNLMYLISRPREISNAQPSNNGFSLRSKVLKLYTIIEIFSTAKYRWKRSISRILHPSSAIVTPAFLVSFLANSDCNKELCHLIQFHFSWIHSYIDFHVRNALASLQGNMENINYPNYLITKSSVLHLRALNDLTCGHDSQVPRWKHIRRNFLQYRFLRYFELSNSRVLTYPRKLSYRTKW